MKTITATLAALLLAGASTAALAQDREHDRADRADHAQGRPAQAAPRGPAPQAAAPQAGPRAPQDGRARFGAPSGPQAAPPAAQQAGPPRGFDRRDGQARDGQPRDFQGQRYQGGPPQGAAPAQQRYDRGGPPGPGAQRQFDQQRSPREVIPPTGGQFDRRDGRAVGGRGGERRDGGVNPWRGGERWQAGRAPPVFWSQNRYGAGGYRAPYGYYVRNWGFGEFLPRGWYGQDYWIGDFLDYDLPYPPPGYEWVRVGGDALMIDRYTGRIVQVVRGIFW
jgi:Ni/Co efflux regulator RcnB